ncbi:hypothetical protein ACE2AJ_17185 [Aquihabitans daechungensis]|uniref:hypothetical protein n=1 Tax=Aquihabitans daechungensis TaxID=1052257 RepID=UPI003B9EDB75
MGSFEHDQRAGRRTATSKRTMRQAVAGAALTCVLLSAGGAAAADPGPASAGARVETSSPVEPSRSVDREQALAEIEQIADELGVSPERLEITCRRNGHTVVTWNGGVVVDFWDPYCAIANWVASLF